MAGAVVAALVTGVFSLTTLIISKEDKVSDSRQKWLEGLREETAKFLGAIDTLILLVQPDADKNPDGCLDTPEKLSAFREKNAGLYKDLNEMQFRVLLRLDPEDHPHLKDTFRQLTKVFYGPCKKSEIEQVRKLQDAITTDTEKAIKRAWNQVKQGESTFQVVRSRLEIANKVLGAAFVVLVVGAVLALTVQPIVRVLCPSPPAQTPAANATGQPSAPVGGAKSQ
jgi:hypothetical protein